MLIEYGFTGSRLGMTVRQRELFCILLAEADVLHHGDCIGGDKQAHGIARVMGKRIIVHPPSAYVYRAFCAGDEVLPEKEYRARNLDIVLASSLLIAAPADSLTSARSGTWATIRRAVKMQRPTKVLFPDGSQFFYEFPVV